MIPLDEALQIVLDSARPLPGERVALAHALGRVLAEDVRSDRDMPPFDRATMDGYACRRADLGGPLTVIETIPAGAAPVRPVGPNECAKIMTGAAVPNGADCVVMIEQTEPADAGRIRFTGEQTPDHISRQGADLAAGQVVLRKAGRIEPQHVAILASVGCTRPLVSRRPSVAIVAGGDELVPPDADPSPFQIRSSNSLQVAAQLARMGIEARDYGIVRDTEEEIDRVLKTALAQHDIVITSGGVSVGDFDFVPAVLRRNGVALRFEKIAVKPGKPTIFGLWENGYCFGLAGNPVSAFVVFELLAKPFLYRLMGHDYAPVEVQLRLGESVKRSDTERQGWIPVRRTSETTVCPVAYHGSGHILAMGDADGLIALGIGQGKIEKGAAVRVRLL